MSSSPIIVGVLFVQVLVCFDYQMIEESAGGVDLNFLVFLLSGLSQVTNSRLEPQNAGEIVVFV